jgi:diketogulonate reductase-like aldo/keto reductase
VKTRPWGKSGERVSAVGQGTWNMERDDREACLGALRRGLDLGLSHVDTAEMYGNGEVERIVGEAIAGRRDEVFLVSKVLPSNASRRGTIEACERSLRRLGTDRLDGYLLHWPGQHPLEDTLEAFEELVREGKIRSWGVSNFDEDEMARVSELAGDGRCACNQVLYHLRERAIEHDVIPACDALGVTVVAYSPFGSGDFDDGAEVLAAIARDHGATPRQVALAFLLRHEGLLVIPKASRVEHTEDNARAAQLELTGEDLRHLERSFPAGNPRCLPSL